MNILASFRFFLHLGHIFTPLYLHLQILPGLQAFCISCAIALASVFLLQTSWFVAYVTLDQKRIADRRDGCFPCIKHKERVNKSIFWIESFLKEF